MTRAEADSRKRQERGNRRRQQILDAAVELFSASGYRATGLAALADRVDMTPTGLLYYFGTKERLLREVVAERERTDRLDPGDGITLKAFREVGRHNAETAVLTRLYVVLGAENLDPEDPLHDFFVDRYETARQLIRDILLLEQSAGVVRQDVDIDQISLEVIATLMGMEIQWLTDPERFDLAEVVATYVDRLAEQLGPEPPRSRRTQRGGAA